MLGVTFSVDLKWNAHVDDIVKKVNKRLYFLCQLKRTQVKSKELILFYLTCIRSVMEYACALFHSFGQPDIVVSSTYFHILQFPVVDRSSIIITKSQGPSFVPCGTPDGMEPHSEKQSRLIFTLPSTRQKVSDPGNDGIS